VILASFASGGGRYPLSGQSLLYVCIQVAVKFFDGIVVATFVIGAIAVNKDGTVALSELPTAEGWERRPLPFVIVGVAYFGLRIADGWLMAGMPMNTPPFVSLASRLTALRA
jgi:hypothetical protein